MTTMDATLDELDRGLSRALTMLKGATPLQLAKVTPMARTWLRGVRKNVDELAADLTDTGCEIRSEKSGTGTIGYKTAPAGIRIHDLARKAAWDLGIPLPALFDIRKATGNEVPDIESTELVGLCRRNPVTVFVHSDLGHRDTLVTLGHEMFHAWEFNSGKLADEEAAEAYGRRFADHIMYGTRLAR